MGKRKHGGGFSGLASFASKAFGQQTDSEEVKIRDTSSKKIKHGDNHRAHVEDEAAPSQQHSVQKYDATGVVPHYRDVSEVPSHLIKYFNQRTTYFSLYSTPPGCLLDEEGWYSVTPEAIATHIAERCRCDTIVDAFCGVGGNTIAFARTCQRVIAIDNNPTRLALARHNAQIYGVAERVEFILADYVSFVKAYTTSSPSSLKGSHGNPNGRRKIDAIFLSPPWGGPSYLDGSESSTTKSDDNGEGNQDHQLESDRGFAPYSLAAMQPVHGAELFNLSRKITRNIAFYLPRNTRIEEVSELVREEREEIVEVEEAWTGSKLKAITCYFGGLASGKEDIF